MTEEELERAAQRLVEAEHPICLTGAGLSVESGIPPFRGPGGIWTTHGEPPMDGFQRFLRDPAGEWRKRLSPEGPMKAFTELLDAAQPNAAHEALVELERLGVLRCVITQNIDGLHRAAGQEHLLEIHGNATLLRCLDCGGRWPRSAIPIDPERLPPHCSVCGGILKSDTVQFGEPIPTDVLERCLEQAARADCCIVAGTSATVFPAAQIPLDILARGGQLIEVNLYKSEITPKCVESLRGPAGEMLSALTRAVKRRLDRR
ncbi:MAG: NAD-dependent deacetylase [Myxococcota bacterium]